MIDAERAKPELPKRRHRWFQFSLRSLMIVVTIVGLFCAFFGTSAKVAWERRAMLKRIRSFDNGKIIRFGHKEDSLGSRDENQCPFPVPWDRRLLGDDAVDWIFVPYAIGEAQLQEIRALFPEANIAAFTEVDPTTGLRATLKYVERDVFMVDK
jgi:hypothetical protein